MDIKDTYIKKLKLDLDVSNVEKYNSYMKDLEKNFMSSAETSEAIEQITKEIEKHTKSISQIKLFGDDSEETKKMLEHAERTLQILEDKKELLESLQSTSTVPTEFNILQKGTDLLQKLLEKVANYFKKQIKDAFDEAREMATYNLASTTTYNREAWSNLMTYGLTGAQSYAFTQAKQAIGVSSDEELYQAMMSPSLQQAFKDYFEMYEESYEKDIEFAKSLQEFEYEKEKFNKEMQMIFLEFFSNNKEIIAKFFNVAISFMDTTLDILEWLVNLDLSNIISSAFKSVIISDRTNSISNSIQNVNVKIDNTYNNENSQNVSSWLTNVGQLSVDAIVNAFK